MCTRPPRPRSAPWLAAALVTSLAAGPALARPDPALADDARALLAAAGDRDAAALDRLADTAAGPVRALAAVARVHTLDGPAAARAAIDAGFIVRWQVLEPLPGGPRALDHVSPALDDWSAARPAGVYAGVLGPTRWRPAGPSPRFGLVEPSALTAAVPGHRMARAAFRVSGGGGVVAWVYSAGPWRLWVDGEPVGGGFGEPGLRAAEPVALNLGPGAHAALLIGDGDDVAFAMRITGLDGAPAPVESLDGRDRPHGVSLGPLPGKPRPIATPIAAIAPADRPPNLSPRSGIAEATPEERMALAEHAPLRADLWRRIAEDGQPGGAADDLWARVAAADPLDIDARRRADPHAWPPPARAPDGLESPPEGFGGPLWWALAEHRFEAGRGGTLIEQHHVAVRVMDPGARIPWPPAAADVAACTLLRSGWVHPLDCGQRPSLRVGDRVVVTWRRGRRSGAARVEPPPAPFGRWSVRVEALADAPLRVDVPSGALVERVGERRVWRVDAAGDGGGPVAVGTVVDDAALFAALDRRLPPARPARVADPARRQAALDAALARSSSVDDPLDSARACIQTLAEWGEVGDPVFARPIGRRPSAMPDPEAWPSPLVALGSRIVDPRHPEGARGPELQGASAVRIDADGRGAVITLPVDPPEAHRLSAVGELRMTDEVYVGITLDRRGHSPLADLGARLARSGIRVLEADARRVAVQQPEPLPVVPLPGWDAGAPSPGPHEVRVELTVRAPRGARAPADVQLDTPAGGYRRTTVPVADGWRTTRHFVWRGAGEGAAALLDAVRTAEAQPLVIGGAP